MSVLPTLSGAYLKKEKKTDTIKHKAILNLNIINKAGKRLHKDAKFGEVKGRGGGGGEIRGGGGGPQFLFFRMGVVNSPHFSIYIVSLVLNLRAAADLCFIWGPRNVLN